MKSEKCGHLRHPEMMHMHKFVSLAQKSIDRVLDAEFHIGFSQAMILMYVHAHPRISQKLISEERDITPAAVSRHVENMVEKGFLHLQSNEHNKREHVLEISEKGISLLQKATDIVNAELDLLFHDVSLEERNVLNKIFVKLLSTFGEREIC